MAIPERVGTYEVRELLGSGGFASVYLAYDATLDDQVAIKVLADNWSASPEAVQRFLREAQILRSLDHPRIARVYATGRLEDGRPYFVMEYADRGTLHERLNERLRQRRLYTVEEAVMLALEIAHALAVAHARNIVHRDLKPSNVLFRSVAAHQREATPTGLGTERILLADFGIARSLEASTGLTIWAGNPWYMAPEQADPATSEHSGVRGDIYSAAVVLYELLTGRVPYPYANFQQVARAATGGPPTLTALRSIRPDVPVALEAAIERGLSPNPDERWPDVAAWIQALEQAMLGYQPAQTTIVEWSADAPSPAGSRTGDTPIRSTSRGRTEATTAPLGSAQAAPAAFYAERNRRRMPFVWIALSVVLLALVAVGSMLFRGSEPPPPTATTTVRAPGIRDVRVSPDSFGPGEAVTIRWSVSGATQIDLEPIVYGLDPGVGEFTFADGFASDTELTLVAHSGNVVSEQVVRIDVGAVPTATTGTDPTSTTAPTTEPTTQGAEPATATPEQPTPTAAPPTATVPPPTSTPEPPTPVPTRQPTVVPTPAAPAAPSEGEIIRNAALTAENISHANGTGWVADGNYHLRVVAVDGNGIANYAGRNDLGNVSVSVEVRVVQGNAGAVGCIAARFDRTSYSFELCLRQDQQVFARYDHIFNGDWVSDVLMPPSSVNANWVSLKLLMRGDEIWFIVNGRQLGYARVSGPATGDVAILVNSWDAQPVEYEFRNFSVREVR